MDENVSQGLEFKNKSLRVRVYFFATFALATMVFSVFGIIYIPRDATFYDWVRMFWPLLLMITLFVSTRKMMRDSGISFITGTDSEVKFKTYGRNWVTIPNDTIIDVEVTYDEVFIYTRHQEEAYVLPLETVMGYKDRLVIKEWFKAFKKKGQSNVMA